MSVSAGTAYVDIAPKLDKFGANLSSGVSKAFGKLGSAPGLKAFESKLGSLGKGVGGNLTKAVTLPVLAIGGAAVASALKVEEAQFLIRRRTGETGAALAGLNKDFVEVGKNTGASFDVVAEILSNVHQRLGLVGAPLQNLTLTVLRLRKVTGDAAPSVDEITKLFAQWGIKTKEQIPLLDTLFRVTQKSGVPMNELVGSLQRFAPQLRTLGFSVKDSAALLGTLGKAGIDTGAVMGGLRRFFGQVAKAGKDPKKAFSDVIERIQALGKAGKDTAALQLGVKLFGSRGIGLVRAAIEGKLSYQGFLDTVNKGKDTIGGAAKATTSFGDRLKKFKNRATLSLAPLGEKLFPLISKTMDAALPIFTKFLGLIAGAPKPILLMAVALAALGPAISIFKKLRESVTTLFQVFKNNPWLLLIAAVVALALLIYKHWGAIRDFLVKVWDGIKVGAKAVGDFFITVFNGILGFFKQWGPYLLAALLGPFGLIYLAFTRFRDKTFGVFKSIYRFVVRIFTDIGSGIGKAVSAIADWLGRTFRGIKSVVLGVWDGIKRGIVLAVNFIIGIVERFINVLTAVPRKFAGIIRHVPGLGFLKSLQGEVHLPRLEHGGTVLESGVAVVHKGETYSGVDGGGMGTVIVNVYPQNLISTKRELVDDIYAALLRKRRSNTALGTA